METVRKKKKNSFDIFFLDQTVFRQETFRLLITSLPYSSPCEQPKSCVYDLNVFDKLT